jgi:hypothetical protein
MPLLARFFAGWLLSVSLRQSFGYNALSGTLQLGRCNWDATSGTPLIYGFRQA